MKRFLPLAALLLFGWACTDFRFTPSPVHVDTFQQAPLPVVDILWVVDNSGSMADEQAKLADKFNLFMAKLVESGADYHIGIVTTDTDDPNHSGRLQGDPKVIDLQTPDPVAAFAANVKVATTASTMERGLDAIRLALSPDLLSGVNQGFIRSQASLFVIVISDEDDHSMGMTNYYSRLLEHQKGAGNENLVDLSAIVGQKPCGCGRDCNQPFHGIGAEAGERYLAVQADTKGFYHSICEDDYGPIVEDLGMNAAGLRRKFYLSEAVQPDTLQVLVYRSSDPDCQQMSDCQSPLVCASGHHCAQQRQRLDGSTGDWVYEDGDNAIFFSASYLPPAGSTIEVAYYKVIQ